MLFLVATPIGNLGDITYRAVETLKSSDLILCEDTRWSIKLLDHYSIKKPLKSYHKFNEASLLQDIVARLRAGEKISLISDAGTPLISDPGYKLVEECIKEKIPFTALPGPCAAIQGLLLSGFTPERFQFAGFLPRSKKELKTLLIELAGYDGISICYESPERILATLKLLSEISQDIPVAIARELTKKFEECKRDTVSNLVKELERTSIKGECVLLIKGSRLSPDFSSLSIEEHVAIVQREYGLTAKEAIKMVAELRGTPKRLIYNKLLK